MKRIALILAVFLALAVPASLIASPTKAKTATDLLRALQRAGMPIGGFVAYTAVTDSNHLLGRPGQYTSKVNFHDNRVPSVKGFDTRGGGSVEVFANRADAFRRLKYVQAFGTTSMFAEYDYLSGLGLLRLSSVLTPSQAARYKAALQKVA